MNDTIEHPAGTACLISVVKTIGEIIAGRGNLYRYGGDEFVVLVPNSNAAETTATAERIRREVERSNPGETIPVTTSIGVLCSADHEGSSAEELISLVDKAMYESKQTGGNRVTVR